MANMSGIPLQKMPLFANMTKEEGNFTSAFHYAIIQDDFLLFMSNCVVPNNGTKRMIVIFNLLKKFWDEKDGEGFAKFLRLFLITHRRELIAICGISTMNIDLSDSILNAESELPEGLYLKTANFLKFVYDIRTETNIQEMNT